jgi:uncharacterized protein
MDRSGSYHVHIMQKVVLLLALLGLPGTAQLYAQVPVPLPPAPLKFVTDAAGVIPDDREFALNERLADFERTNTHQVIVYVDRNIPAGTTLEEMSAEAIRTWRVGQAKRDNGAILFLFIDSRDSRIEVGYGLEGTLTDAMSKRILVGMRPWLQTGDYAGAVEQGAGEIIRAITPEPPAAEPRQIPPPTVPQQIAPAPETSFFDGLIACFAVCLVTVFGVWLLIVFVRALINANWNSPSGSSGWTPRDSGPSSSDSTSSWSPSSSSSSWGSSDSSSSSSSSSSSGSSDFSGGGGSGGGGGASDKW